MYMTANDKFEYWLDIAQYDLTTADAMFEAGRWLYVVFICEQAIEKLCKGLYVLYKDDDVPRVHSISQIVKRFEDSLSVTVTDEQYQFFNRLSSFYLEGRYPEYMQKLSVLLNEQEAQDILHKTREVFSWLLTLKPSETA
jgi:HEPN domain-containing protein